MQLEAVIANEAVVQPLNEGTSITRDLSNRMSRANIRFRLNRPFVVGLSKVGDTVEFSPQHGDTVIINQVTASAGGGDSGSIPGLAIPGVFIPGAAGAAGPETRTPVFTGNIVNISKTRGDERSTSLIADVEALDYVWLMNNTYVTETYNSQTDRAVIQDVLTTTGLDSTILAPDATVDIIDSDVSISFDSLSVSDALDTLCDVTGGQWSLTPGGTLQYNSKANAGAASFALSDSPDEVTTFAYHDLSLRATSDRLANRVTVIGSEFEDGTRVTATVTDAVSQSKYGTFTRTIKDDRLTSVELCTKRGNIDLAADALPHTECRCRLLKDGLDINQLINVTSKAQSLASASLLIRRVAFRQLSSTLTEYDLDLGDARPSQENLLRRFRRDLETPSISRSGDVRCYEFQGESGSPYPFIAIRDETQTGYPTIEGFTKLTIAVWLYPTWGTPIAERFGIYNHPSPASFPQRFSCYYSDTGVLTFLACTSGGNVMHSSATASLTNNQWNHIAVRYAGGLTAADIELYVNGTETSYSDSRSIPSGTLNDDTGQIPSVGLAYAESPNAVTRAHLGYMAQFGLWNEAIPIYEIQKLAQRPLETAFLNAVPSAARMLYKLNEFDDGDDATGDQETFDSSGYGHHGDPTSSGDLKLLGALKFWGPTNGNS